MGYAQKSKLSITHCTIYFMQYQFYTVLINFEG